MLHTLRNQTGPPASQKKCEIFDLNKSWHILPQQLLLFGQVRFALVQVEVVEVLVQVEVVEVEGNGRFFRLNNSRHLEQIATDFNVVKNQNSQGREMLKARFSPSDARREILPV